MALPKKVGFVGLGAMGFGMAVHLQNKKYEVTGFDVSEFGRQRFQASGGSIASSSIDAAKDNEFFVVMVATAEQANSVLFGQQDDSAAQYLPHGAVILLCSTVPADFVGQVQKQLLHVGRPDIHLVDCPVSGGTARAAKGDLTILAAGSPDAIEKAITILSHMSSDLFIIPGGIGSASNVKMINQLLVGTHIVAAAEAMGLAARSGLNTREVYNIITNAAGNSWAFQNRVTSMLDDDWRPLSALDIFVKDMGIVTSTARSQNFPVPLAAAAEQQYLAGASSGYGKDHDASVVRVYLPKTPTAVRDAATARPQTMDLTLSEASFEVKKIAFVGLGAMGFGMASSLLRAGYSVQGYDVYPPTIDRFLTTEGKASSASSPADAASDADVFILMVQNATQVEDALFGNKGAAESLPKGAVVILSSTVPPTFIRSLEKKLLALDKGIEIVDAPVSGGVKRAATGDLTIICSGSSRTISAIHPVLIAMSGAPKNLCLVQGGTGAASSVKLINQLLAGVHIAAAAEAMAFSAKVGLDPTAVFEIIKTAAGHSWMFENRVPAMLIGDWTPHSSLAIFVKDLGIVLDEAKKLRYPAPLTAAAHQLYLFGAGSGWLNEADSGIVRLWETLTGVSVSKRDR